MVIHATIQLFYSAETFAQSSTVSQPSASNIVPINFTSGQVLSSFVLWSVSNVNAADLLAQYLTNPTVTSTVCPNNMCASITCTIQESNSGCEEGSGCGQIPEYKWYRTLICAMLTPNVTNYKVLAVGLTAAHKASGSNDQYYPVLSCVVICQYYQGAVSPAVCPSSTESANANCVSGVNG